MISFPNHLEPRNGNRTQSIYVTCTLILEVMCALKYTAEVKGDEKNVYETSREKMERGEEEDDAHSSGGGEYAVLDMPLAAASMVGEEGAVALAAKRRRLSQAE